MAVDRTLSSRFECKYWIPEALVPAVRAHIRPFLRPDRFAVNAAGYRYPLTSLYLDSPQLDLLRSTQEGHKNRFKLRIRSYSDQADAPVFFEIKRRVARIVRKRRGQAVREAALRVLEGEVLSRVADSEVVEEFLRLARNLDARPIVRVKYNREAYESRGGDPVRVTLDRDLQYAVTPDWNLSLNGPGYRPARTEGTILEIKFTDRGPSWMTSLVERLELYRSSIPKYVLCVNQASRDGRLVRPALLRARRTAVG